MNRVDVFVDKITFTLLAPDNIYHTILYENEKWFGMENAGTAIDNTDTRWYTIRKLKQLMLTEIEGKWAGFEWVPID